MLKRNLSTKTQAWLTVPVCVGVALLGEIAGYFIVFAIMAFVAESHHFLLGGMLATAFASSVIISRWLGNTPLRLKMLLVYFVVWGITFLFMLGVKIDKSLFMAFLPALIPISVTAMTTTVALFRQKT